ncbi:hypothetical protein IGI04_002470 [Brassica rapa subsp. trilocularis]|uniref:Retrotransposon gag domain-containing protein n=1 Tax=Brassica rapa subsp. trilocularis TaxID=1813537 RepID=A0ABQ7NVL6_BRACM|nr:hypothetical protein IGI04_002470 [Brassica rapa subsp. trilocularis]
MTELIIVLDLTISGNVDGKEGNAPETHGTRNGTHGDVGKVEMCVLNPVPRNPGWKWEGAGPAIVNVEGEFEQLRVFGQDQINQKVIVPQCSGVSEVQEWDDGGSSWGKKDDGGSQEAKYEMLIRIRDLHRAKGLTVFVFTLHDVFTSASRARRKTHALRAYARKPYRDAWGDVVPALFPDEEEMEFAEPPNAPIQETTVRRQILMPHFQRAAEYRRLYQGRGTFQFAPEVDTTPPTRGRGRPRKTGPTREGPGPIRMEDSVPTRKRGRPRKIPSIDAESLRRITGICRCGTLTQARQGPRSVREYTEEFLESAKRCKPKTAEDWCRWYTAGLREEIRGKLIGVLEPWEFALVNRMAGQAMEAERTLTRRVVAISSSEEDVEVEEDPSEDSDWEEEPASPTGSGRAAGPKQDGEQKSPVRSG